MRILSVLLCLLPSFVAADPSKAAQWLAAQQVAEGCTSGQGTFNADGLRELDLNGDGRDDLILDHAGLECVGTGMAARSTYCGMQVCSAYFYLRNSDGLLILSDEMLGTITSVSSAPLPVVSGYAHGGATWQIVWSGSGFDLIQ